MRFASAMTTYANMWWLAHVTNTLRAMELRAPVDLVFQSIGGRRGRIGVLGFRSSCSRSAGGGVELQRGTVGDNVMLFRDRTGQRAVGGRA